MLSCTRKIQFCAGHRVLGHEGKCSAPHGHQYEIEIEARAEQLDDIGRVIDFSVLKREIGGWIDQYWDHAFLVYEKDDELFDSLSGIKGAKLFACPFNPTAENIAQYLLLRTCPNLLIGLGVTVTSVTVHETPNCYATATLEPDVIDLYKPPAPQSIHPDRRSFPNAIAEAFDRGVSLVGTNPPPSKPMPPPPPFPPNPSRTLESMEESSSDFFNSPAMTLKEHRKDFIRKGFIEYLDRQTKATNEALSSTLSEQRMKLKNGTGFGLTISIGTASIGVLQARVNDVLKALSDHLHSAARQAHNAGTGFYYVPLSWVEREGQFDVIGVHSPPPPRKQ